MVLTDPLALLLECSPVVLDLGSILGWVIAKTQKMVLDASFLNTQHYNVRIKGEWSNPGKGVASSLTPQSSCYWKEILQATLDYGRLIYKLMLFYVIISN